MALPYATTGQLEKLREELRGAQSKGSSSGIAIIDASTLDFVPTTVDELIEFCPNFGTEAISAIESGNPIFLKSRFCYVEDLPESEQIYTFVPCQFVDVLHEDDPDQEASDYPPQIKTGYKLYFKVIRDFESTLIVSVSLDGAILEVSDGEGGPA